MPYYDYQCDCGIRFEEYVSFHDRDNPCHCPQCGDEARRLMPNTVSGVFRRDVTGPTPQNTGVSSLDTHIDRVIGQSAAQGWMTQKRRVQDKKEVLRKHPGATGHDLSEESDGSWRVISKEERGFRDRAVKINSLAMETLNKRR